MSEFENAWTMTLRFGGGTFEQLKHVAEQILGDITKAQTFKQLPISGAGTSGGENWASFSVEYTCPLEMKIANLRAEADRLEKTLGEVKP